MRKAVIDLGTNTFHLLICDIEGETITEVYKNQIAVKLGEGGIENSEIAAPAFERGLLALENFSSVLKTTPCEEVHVIATSAIRSAKNGADFIEQAKKRSGLIIQCITGLEEADWIAKGVFRSVPKMTAPYLIMDIGGGSVEFIICEEHQILFKQSLDIGAARLLGKFQPSDPMLPSELALLRNYLETQLSGLLHHTQTLKAFTLVGSAGSFESILDLISDLPDYSYKMISPACYELDIHAFNFIFEILIRSTHLEREKMKGLADYRVEMMVVSSVLIDTVLKMGRMERMYCSLYSLKEGVLIG